MWMCESKQCTITHTPNRPKDPTLLTSRLPLGSYLAVTRGTADVGHEAWFYVLAPAPVPRHTLCWAVPFGLVHQSLML